MSVETVSVEKSRILTAVEDLNDEQLGDRLHGIWAATTRAEAEQVEARHAEFAQLFSDKHATDKEQYQHQKEVLLETMMENPTEAFRGEFLQLELIFESRSAVYDRYDGEQTENIVEFCTQDHNRQKADHIFRHTQKVDGRELYEIQTTTRAFGEVTPVRYTWEDEVLSVITPVLKHGKLNYVQAEGNVRERLLAELFVDTIKASATQLERTPTELEENDRRARSYLGRERNRGYVL
jgi:hypothetical protein